MNYAYRIKNWNEYFENSESRKLKSKSIRFITIPNKQDGKGFNRICRDKSGCEIFTAWIMILQVASKLPERGLLVDEQGALTSEDLSLMTRFDEKIFDKAFKFLSDSKIGWLEKIECPKELNISGRKSESIPLNPDESQEIPKSPTITEQNRIKQNKTKKGKPDKWASLPEILNTQLFKDKWEEYEEYRRSVKIKKLQPTSVVKQWNKISAWGLADAIESIDQTIANGWQGLFEPQVKPKPKQSELPCVSEEQQKAAKEKWDKMTEGLRNQQ